MRRTQVQLDEHIYRLAKERAYEEGVSLSAVVREALAQYVLDVPSARPLTLEDFGFVGIGRSDQGDLSPVSENHDEALARALEEELAEKRPQGIEES